MTRAVKLTIVGVVLGVLPFFVFFGATSETVENGVVTQSSYLNIAAIAGGIAAVWAGFALLSPGYRAASEYRRPGWALPVCALLALLGALQVVRGLGLVPVFT
jgi:hypothetical protein